MNQTRAKVIWAAVGMTIFAALSGVLYYFDPATHGFYPGCLFHRLTGLDCPGCGGLRAVHHLLHGEIAAAFHYNALFVVALPVGLLVAAKKVFLGVGVQTSVVNRSSQYYWIGLLVLLLFGIVRNLPIAPFEWMAP